ncbi:MAG: DUF2911 domain-containing protein [Gemmatimonadetes bacterium]|nr:DUF2911 domain-containing protein [Gemmatimonadota bacterium]
MSRVAFATVWFTLLGTASALAQGQPRPDSGAFIVRLGVDTISIERYVRTANRLEAEAVHRTPRTTLRRFALEWAADGSITRLESSVRAANAPADAAPTSKTVVTFSGDSAVFETTQGTNPPRTRKVPGRPDMVPQVAAFYSPYEEVIRRARQAGVESVALNMLGGGGPSPVVYRRMGRDSVALTTEQLGTWKGRLDRQGRLVSLDAGMTNLKIDRLRWPNLEALAQNFADRDARGVGLGPLSPRDTARATVRGAMVLVDYGRPAKRGRAVFGALVPWNQVWRMGANEATHFLADHDVVIGSTTVPAGLYTLWTMPSPTGWKLIVNKRTGQWGTDYDGAYDFARIDMQTWELSQPVERFTIRVEEQGDGGVLKSAWDLTQVSVPFTVKPLTAEQRIVNDAAKAMGGWVAIHNANTLLFEGGKGRQYSLGQNVAPAAELPAFEVSNYRAAVDVPAGRWRVDVERTPAFPTGNPSTQRFTNAVDGEVAFNIQPNGDIARASEQVAQDRAAVMYNIPVVALRAATGPGARLSGVQKVGERDEVMIESRDGMKLKLAVDGMTRLPASVTRWESNTVLGDVAVESWFDGWQDAGAGLKLPTRWTGKTDQWTSVEITYAKVAANTNVGDLQAPKDVREADPPAPPTPNVTVEEAAPGIWYLAGQSHHSILVEFSDHLLLIEAPQNDMRTLAVIQKAKELRPNKPLKYVVASHHHFDHSGGIRAAVSEGLTVIAHEKTKAFFEDVVARKHTIQPDALSGNPRPLLFLPVKDREKLVRKDKMRTIEIYPINGSPHAETLLMVYFPKERLLAEADVFTPPPPDATTMPQFPHAANLLENITKRKLKVDRILPIHGRIVPFAELSKVAQPAKAAGGQ